MARIFTLGSLVTRAQQRCDMENQTLLSTAEFKGHLSTVYGEMYSEILATGLRHFETTKTITTTGAASFTLPADFLSVIGMDYVVDTQGHRRHLRELMAQERNIYRGASASDAQAFAIVGDKTVTMYPTPPTAQTYEFVYVPQPKDLSTAANSTQVDVVTPDGEAFLLWGVAVLALGKEESDIQLALMERERMRERVREWATLRALNQPRRVMVESELDEYEPGEWRMVDRW